MKYLLDSNVFIYHLNDDLTAKGNELFEQAVKAGAAYSAITRLEVLGYALKEAQRHRAIEVLALFQELAIEDSTIDQAIDLRSTVRIKSIDALIAATALSTSPMALSNRDRLGKALDLRQPRQQLAGPAG
ncbi:MAG: type II toxin-antitoxin system VapC family toxin [Cyanobacteriota bacterium]